MIFRRIDRIAAVFLATLALAACAREVGEAHGGGGADASRPQGVVYGSAVVPTASADTTPVSEERPELARFFAEEGVEGTFVLWDSAENRITRYNPERAARRFRPASTFKIANALIALDNGVASGPDFALAWDSVRDPRRPGRDSWYRDHTLRTAMRESAVWYYQELARRTGEARMRAALARIGYGNQDTSDGIDRFWLAGSLRISADEQVAFLRRLHAGQLGFSPRATDAVKEIITLEQGPGWKLSGKTGAYPPEEGRMVTWMVGTVEREGRLYVYAMNAEGPTDAVFPTRATRARAILAHLGLVPAAP